MIEKLTDAQIRDWGHVCGLSGAMGFLMATVAEVAENDLSELERCAKQFFAPKRVKFLVKVLKIFQAAQRRLEKVKGGDV